MDGQMFRPAHWSQLLGSEPVMPTAQQLGGADAAPAAPATPVHAAHRLTGSRPAGGRTPQRRRVRHPTADDARPLPTPQELASEVHVARAELDPLTAALRDVLCLRVRGLTCAEIARLRSRSTKTIEDQCLRIRRVLGMSLMEAAMLAVRARWA